MGPGDGMEREGRWDISVPGLKKDSLYEGGNTEGTLSAALRSGNSGLSENQMLRVCPEGMAPEPGKDHES